MYAIFATIIELPIAIILWHPPIFHIIAGLLSHIMDFGVFLIIPFTIICTLMSSIFSLILLPNPRLNEKSFTSICFILCLVVAVGLYGFTADMLYNIDKETTNTMNLRYRILPYLLFVIWGYFLSRYLYRNNKKISDA